MHMTNPKMVLVQVHLLVLSAFVLLVYAESVREFEVSENVAVGTVIGFIGDGNSAQTNSHKPPYLIVPVPGSAVDSDLDVDSSTGEIRTKVPLDREVRSHYSFVAIPQSGDTVRVAIGVRDENDNAPKFPESSGVAVEFPENAPRDSKRTLAPARDRDTGVHNVQGYRIASGNVHNAFRLASHRERDDVLYLDIQVNGFLDREAVPLYSLVIEAFDGGSPPLVGSTMVNVTIVDVNDNPPQFGQSRYVASVPENASVGSSVLRVVATDADSGDNGRVSYSINRRQSDREGVFAIDARTGVVSLGRPLDFEARDVHELVVVARDSGAQPLEATAFVTVHVADVNDNQPTINLIFLSDDASPKIAEDAQPGEFVARISVNDPDSKAEYSNVNVTLAGGDGHFGLTTRDSVIYLVFVRQPLDREVRPNYTLVVTATDQGSPPLQVSATFELRVTDVNDNAPEFEQAAYFANVLEVADPGTSVLQVTAVDRDDGNNSVVSYSLRTPPDAHSQWFQIDSATGLVTTKAHVDCETEPSPRLTVVATDRGDPPLSASATVTITILDVNDNEPIFDQSFYNVSLSEDQTVGRCFLKVSATDADCGVNGKVNYTLEDGAGRLTEFQVNSISGEICLKDPVDHERRNMYEFPVVATDRGGLSTTAMVKIQVMDVNDNRPVFYPREYNVSLKDGAPVTSTPIVIVVATDADSQVFGSITYSIVDGNTDAAFRIDPNTGEILVTKSLNKSVGMHHLTISATDRGGMTSSASAHVWISVTDGTQRPPSFERARYSFVVSEGVPKGAVVGTVLAVVPGQGGEKSDIRYSIYSGDPDGYFTIDPVSGAVTVNSELDREKRAFLLLNVQSQSGHPPSYGHTQVNITIKDVNDNSPSFESTIVKISVPENADPNSAIYVAHAVDPDGGENGRVSYRLLENAGGMFKIGASSGYLTPQRSLDYESEQHYRIIIGAVDGGSPPRQSNMTLALEMQDVNDNAPTFTKTEYVLSVAESHPLNAPFLQVSATDKDTGNNARLTYVIKEEQPQTSVFGIFPNSGALYLKTPLDREDQDRHTLTLIARDNGSPALSTTATVFVRVLDVNDHTPEFSKSEYAFGVAENAEGGIRVGVIAASDRDLGNNATLRFSFAVNDTHFHINPITGEIITRMSLDREEKAVYDLTVFARDKGMPSRSSRVSVRITVNDINDNAPAFVEPRQELVAIREEDPPGTEIVHIKAVDGDASNNGTVRYSLIKAAEAPDADAFEIDAESGVMSTRASLDHERKSVYLVAVRAVDGGNPSKETIRVLRVEVLGPDDGRRPAFASASLEFNVAEDVSPGTKIGEVGTSGDADPATNSISGDVVDKAMLQQQQQVAFAIVAGNHDAIFAINRTTGSLFVVRELDYEVTAQHILVIKAVDVNAVNPLESVVNVTVTVEDVNDHSPNFAEDPVLCSVAEGSVAGYSVWNLTAGDDDSGRNGEIRYTIVSQSPASVFEIDGQSGALRVKRPPDHEVHAEYTLVVSATDLSSNSSLRRTSSVTARVNILDSNDNAPIFASRSRLSVDEDVPIGHPVVTMVAQDADNGDNGLVSYAIVGGNDEGFFELNPSTGLLTVKKLLDRETTWQYSLNVSASDHGLPRRTVFRVVEIEVDDINDNAPKFEKNVYVANVSESAPIGTFLVKVHATDPDEGVNANLTYLMAEGSGEGRFSVDALSGEMRTTASLDDSERGGFVVTVLVRDGGSPALIDKATLLVDIRDENDNSPDFHDSCYPLVVPENNDRAVVHTVVAVDKDPGSNGQVTYSIADGNTGNKFSIDPHTGALWAAPLDREVTPVYHLGIVAEDRGHPPRRVACNLTITVDDQNDHAPRFTQDVYMLTVQEGVPVNTTVLMVTASDADEGENARLTYSLVNGTQWVFKIHSTTGEITTAGLFDRERKSSYSFEVRATDSGKYDARSETALVQVQVVDVNDNKPTFAKFPFSVQVPVSVQPGSEIARIVAHDKDEGQNADITYRFDNFGYAEKFSLNSDTGVVTVIASLHLDSRKVFYATIIATDRGNPPQSSTGMLEIRVGDVHDLPGLTFRNSSYTINVAENLQNGREVARLSATYSSEPMGDITYTFGSGNENEAFDINPNTGVVRVKDGRQLDYEIATRLELIALAHSSNGALVPPIGFAALRVNLVDQNDNPPRFTQDHYVSAVWEGNSKGTFVVQVSATDDDHGTNGNIAYHIVDGNYDNAFVIEPPFSGIVKTNIVLDREIRDAYRLTIIAIDDGSPQLTGTCTLRINIIDVNDNQPTFPPQSIVSISESATVGSVVSTITANDVDTNPALTYSFTDEGNPGETFSIDRFSGMITLSRPLDREQRGRYVLRVRASDTAYSAETTVTVNVIDENDNAPHFTDYYYQAVLSDRSMPGLAVITMNATDADIGENGRISYSLSSPSVQGFYINENTGAIYANFSAGFERRQPLINLVVIAQDHGNPPLTSSATAHLQMGDFGTGSLEFSQNIYIAHVAEDTPPGTTVARVLSNAAKFTSDRQNVRYGLRTNAKDSKEAEGAFFEMDRATGAVILVRPLDRESKRSHHLLATANRRSSASSNVTAEVIVYVDDVNDNAPRFNRTMFICNVSESASIGFAVMELTATDDDEGDNAKIRYDITSGNDDGIFEIHPASGALVLAKKVDYEASQEYRLVVRATDGNRDRPLSSLATVLVSVIDENDNAPVFPVPLFVESIPENSATGTFVFSARAYDADKGVYGHCNYSIIEDESDGGNLFTINPDTGHVATAAVFDYEDRNSYDFVVSATDSGGKRAFSTVRVEIESKDEFAPVFKETSYRFTVPGDCPAGFVFGRVQANDADAGPDGRVVYHLRNVHPNFRVNRTSGEVAVRAPFRAEDAFRGRRRERSTSENEVAPRTWDVSLVVSASSGRPDSLTSVAVLEVSVDLQNGTALAAGAQEEAVGGLPRWTLGLVIALAVLAVALFGIIVFLRFRHKKRGGKPGIGPSFDSAFDTIDIRPPPASPRGLSHHHHHHHHHQYPPGYDDIAHYGATGGAGVPGSGGSGSGRGSGVRTNTTSEISDQSHSASSGRGSAEEGEDVEDEEIRMINEGPLLQQKMRLTGLQPDSGIQGDNGPDDDRIRDGSGSSSDSSVHNTQEYLARLGIDTSCSASNKSSQVRKEQDLAGLVVNGPSVEAMHMFDDDGGESDSVDIGNLIYARLGDPGSSSASAAGGEGGLRNSAFGFGEEGPEPSMTGSLSSIVHSEEELTGSYNWDYLLDWGPQYQPLAHVFAEIAHLKDDSLPPPNPFCAPVNPAPRKLVGGPPPPPPPKQIPPPLITNVAPRSIAPVARTSHLTSAANSTTHSGFPALPRSPISHEGGFAMGSAMCPSFSPSLSPLAARSPSISPMVAPATGPAVGPKIAFGAASMSSSNMSSHHGGSHRAPRTLPTRARTTVVESDNELRI